MEENTLIKHHLAELLPENILRMVKCIPVHPTTQSGKSAVVTVMQVNPLKVNVSISEQYYPLIKIRMKAT